MDKSSFDVILIGAGMAGIAAARQLKKKCPANSFSIFESKPSFGGTWQTHRYPGVRADSDFFTFGYESKPWNGNPIADGSEILNYLEEAIHEAGLEDHIRYRHQLISASWSSETQQWCLKIRNLASDELEQYSCNFLWMCNGYYRHEQGYTPDFPGVDSYEGTVVHPQSWPTDLDYSGKRLVIIGSGATAVTLAPSLADEAAHISMLQRSPTYFRTNENRNELADRLRDLGLPEEQIHKEVRQSLLQERREAFDFALTHPDAAAKELIVSIRRLLGDDYDVEKHFTPKYRPGTQRIALAPDGDLFKNIAAGKITMVTDEVRRFNRDGILTKSGEQLDAEIIVTATGFDMTLVGDVAFYVDGDPIDFGAKYTYYGVLASGVPNLAFMFGYLRTSWTMRIELVCEFVCRLINHMNENELSSCTPALRDMDEDMETTPFIASDNFNPGYIDRQIHLFPKQGDKLPWRFLADYYAERDVFRAIDFQDDVLNYESYPRRS